MREILFLTCKEMKKKLKDGTATAAVYQAIRGLLKDNGITAMNIPGSPANELAEELAKKAPVGEFPFAVDGPLLTPDDPAVKNKAHA